jgi:hypothetical protein
VKTRRPLLTTPPQLQRRDVVRLQREVLATQPWVGLGGLVLSAVVFFERQRYWSMNASVVAASKGESTML